MTRNQRHRAAWFRRPLFLLFLVVRMVKPGHRFWPRTPRFRRDRATVRPRRPHSVALGGHRCGPCRGPQAPRFRRFGGPQVPRFRLKQPARRCSRRAGRRRKERDSRCRPQAAERPRRPGRVEPVSAFPAAVAIAGRCGGVPQPEPRSGPRSARPSSPTRRESIGIDIPPGQRGAARRSGQPPPVRAARGRSLRRFRRAASS